MYKKHIVLYEKRTVQCEKHIVSYKPYSVQEACEKCTAGVVVHFRVCIQ